MIAYYIAKIFKSNLAIFNSVNLANLSQVAKLNSVVSLFSATASRKKNGQM